MDADWIDEESNELFSWNINKQYSVLGTRLMRIGG
jgi:hypothetical protein